MLAIARGEAIAQEEHVELAAFGRARDVLHQREVGPAGDGIGVSPAGDVMSRRLDENAEAHLAALSIHVLLLLQQVHWLAAFKPVRASNFSQRSHLRQLIFESTPPILPTCRGFAS